MGYSPWGCKELDTTKHAHATLFAELLALKREQRRNGKRERGLPFGECRIEHYIFLFFYFLAAFFPFLPGEVYILHRETLTGRISWLLFQFQTEHVERERNMRKILISSQNMYKRIFKG